MAYLKTVITYNLPPEAEVDKAFLESHGLNVCLLNGNTARNELGAPFFIQLQVAEEEYGRAVSLLREANPSRFGSPARVDELDRELKHSVGLFFLGAIPVVVLILLIMPASMFRPGLLVNGRQMPDLRPVVTILAGVVGGILAIRLGGRKKSGQSGAPVSGGAE